jgi:hypothetical protein
MNSSSGTTEVVRFRIRTLPDQRLLGISPILIAAYHVLRRLLVPRHSPYALSSLHFAVDSPLGRTKVDNSLLQYAIGSSDNLENPIL